MKRAALHARAKFGGVYFLLHNPLSRITAFGEEKFSPLSSFPSVGGSGGVEVEMEVRRHLES